MIWGDISRYVNGGNVLGCVAYKNKMLYHLAGGGGGYIHAFGEEVMEFGFGGRRIPGFLTLR